MDLSCRIVVSRRPAVSLQPEVSFCFLVHISCLSLSLSHTHRHIALSVLFATPRGALADRLRVLREELLPHSQRVDLSSLNVLVTLPATAVQQEVDGSKDRQVESLSPSLLFLSLFRS